jgi:glycosyltransferase involved in cell wall biosynthesis
MGEKKISKYPIFGINADLFKITDKTEARIKLNLPLDKKIVLQLGRATRNRGVDILIEKVWPELKKAGIYLFMVDAWEEDDCYQMAVDAGIPCLPAALYADVPVYFNAADLLIYLPFDDENLKFAGTSYVPLESLACGTPVVASTMRHFQGGEKQKGFRVPWKIEEIFPMAMELLNDPPSREECRELVLQYYNWKNVISQHIEIYNNLLRDYYKQSAPQIKSS